MSWMKHNKLAKTISASILAVGICFGTTAIANAVCRYPVTSGSYIEGTYHVEMQIGNPGMLSDGDQAMVDCLHKAGIVPKNYDKEAYKKDLDAHAKNQPTTVDFSNAEMQSCWVANGASFGDVNDTDQWKPLG